MFCIKMHNKIQNVDMQTLPSDSNLERSLREHQINIFMLISVILSDNIVDFYTNIF